MQPYYEMADTLYHGLSVDDCCSSTHHLHHQQYHLQSQQLPGQTQQQKEPCHEYEKVYQMCQHPHQFQASQQGGYLLGSNGHRYCEGLPHYLGVPNCGQPQEESSAKVPFWKAINTTLSDAKGKNLQVNDSERCLVSENNFGELEEAVYILSRNKLETTQIGFDSVQAVDENLHAVANNFGVALSTNVPATTAFFGEEGSTRRARKRTRKIKLEEEMGLMSEFFKRLVKRVISNQEVLQSKFLEVIERMEKARAEREEAWRREESEIYEREAIAREHEQHLASRRRSCIVSYIEQITGQSFNLVSKKLTTKNLQITAHETRYMVQKAVTGNKLPLRWLPSF